MPQDELVQVTNSLSPDYSLLENLDSYEDYLSFYIQLEEAQAGVAWMKADTLLHMLDKLGNNSPVQLSKDLKLPTSTVSNYIRVARAFPVDKREPLMTFSAHLEASFADSYNDRTGEFNGEKRMKWIVKAAEDMMSTRQIKKEISESKEENTERNEIRELVKHIMNYVGAKRDQALKGDMDAKDSLKMLQEHIYE